MWFLDGIITWLDKIEGYFLDAYQEVSGWVFPFYYLATPLYYLYYSFYYLTHYFYHFNVWVDDTVTKLGTILNIEQIWSALWYPLYLGEYAYSWVKSYTTYVGAWVMNWWSSTQDTVKTWIQDAQTWWQTQLNYVWQKVNEFQATIDEFLTQMPSINEILAWFADWPDKILAQIISWGALTGSQISTLIDSRLHDWLPFYNELTSLWNDIKLFFTDPLQWLYDRAEEFVDRFW